MPKRVVVYVSRSGHSRALAENVATLLDCTASEIVDKENRRGLFGFLRTGSQSMRGIATPIDDPNVDLSEAETVVLVQPTWASSATPPLRTWLQAHKAELAGKKIALLVSNWSSPGEKLKTGFETEFGPLTSFAVVKQRSDDATRTRILDDFVTPLR